MSKKHNKRIALEEKPIARIKTDRDKTTKKRLQQTLLKLETQKARKSTPATGELKKSRRFKPGTVAPREAWCYQKSTKYLARRLFCECAHSFKVELRFEKAAMNCLQ